MGNLKDSDMKIEIEFNKKGIIFRYFVNIPCPEGESTEVIEKNYDYEKIKEYEFNLTVSEIEPVYSNGVLVAIKLRGILSYLNKKSIVSVPKLDKINEDVIIECIRKHYKKNLKGEQLNDLIAIIKSMLKGYSRTEAVKLRAKERGVYYQTVYSNISFHSSIKYDELDEILNKILKCISYRYST